MYRINDIINGKNKNFYGCKQEILIKLKHLSTEDVEKVFEKVKEALEVSQHVFNDRSRPALRHTKLQVGGPKLGRILKDDLETVRSRVAKELGQRRQAQVRPLSPLHCTSGNTSSASWWGRSDEGGDGYYSDPGSSQSDQSRLSLAQTEPQSLDSALLARVQMLEQRHIEHEQKLEQLVTLCSDLETSNTLLHSALDEKTSHIEQLEKKLEDQRTQISSLKDQLDSSMVALENQRDKIKKLEEVVQRIPSTSRGAQAPPPNSDSEEGLGSISNRLNSIENALTHEFSANFGSQNRADKLDKLVDELKSKIDNLNSGRSQSQPQCTPWQYWKSEACTIIGTSRQGQKSTRTFGCFDDNCPWRNKCVTLNAYINHLKREPHNVNISTNPDMRLLPKV